MPSASIRKDLFLNIKTNIELKETLLQLKRNNYTGIDSFVSKSFVRLLLSKIGSLDSELRDDLIYESLIYIIHNGLLDDNDFIELLEIVSSNNYIGFNIDKSNVKYVFKRTFSMLVVGLIIEWNHMHQKINSEKVRMIFNRVINVFNKEMVLIGYHEKYGWAHSVAHSADTIAEFVACASIEGNEIEQILIAVKRKFSQGREYFIYGEDERIANIFIEVIKKDDNAYIDIIKEWICNICNSKLPDNTIEATIVKGNIRNLVRSIYFKTNNEEIRKLIEIEVIKTKYS